MSKKFDSNIMTAIYIIFIFHFLMIRSPLDVCVISTNCNNNDITKSRGIWHVFLFFVFLKIDVSLLSCKMLLYFCAFLTPRYMQRSDPKNVCAK